MTKQQESIILKGIAQNLLQMNVPNFNEANTLFNQFEHKLVNINSKEQSFDEYWEENHERIIKLNISYNTAQSIFNHEKAIKS